MVVGIDESAAMLAHVRRLLPRADFRVARVEDELSAGPFEIVVSALSATTSIPRTRPTYLSGWHALSPRAADSFWET